MRVKLVTGRTLEQGEGIETGKKSKDYQDNVSIIYLSEKDMQELGIKENSPVKVTTDSGFVVVNCKKDNLNQGIAFMPLGPWTSVLMSADTSGIGLPQSKGIEAEISKTDQNVKSLEEIVRSLGSS